MVLAYDQGAKIANARSRSHKIPILASAVMEGARSAQSTVEVIKVLLAANADPCSIPKDLWTRYWTRPRAMKDQDDDDLSSDSERECGDCARTITKSPTTEAWCTPALRTKLASSLDISQRYCLWKAFQQPPQMARATHADKLLSLSTLREIPYYLVGQDIAARTVSLSIFSHVAHKDREPLTLVFCGPSGHGKTELAQRLAKIHGVEFAFVDTAGLRSTHDLLGGTASYKNSEQGSVLNNHLAKFSGKPSIAFLDEIDKTDDEVIEALLLITGSGKYTDRRSGTEVDCSTTIFIMATNEGDGIIERFYARKMAHLPEEKKASVKIEPLLLELRAKFIGKFGAPFTGRIKSIVPFFPFSEGEQMVVAHEFILEMANSFRGEINMPLKDLIGRTHVTLHRDEEVCEHVAKSSYNTKLEARVIKNAVDGLIRSPLDRLWRDHEDRVSEKMNRRPLTKYMVQLAKDGGDAKIHVFEKGVTEVKDGRCC